MPCFVSFRPEIRHIFSTVNIPTHSHLSANGAKWSKLRQSVVEMVVKCLVVTTNSISNIYA